MRSTRGKTRAMRHQHYTAAARITQPVRSNSQQTVPGQPGGTPARDLIATGIGRGSRQDTNTNRKNGGRMGTYYRMHTADYVGAQIMRGH